MGTQTCVVLWPFNSPAWKEGDELAATLNPARARRAQAAARATPHNRVYFCKCTRVIAPLVLSPVCSMADRNSRSSVKKKDKKAETQTNDDKEKVLKKAEKAAKTPEKTPEQPEQKRNGENGGATGGEAGSGEENGQFQPIELPPFEIVTGWVQLNTHTCFTLNTPSYWVIASCFVS